jgi:anti-sigma regulatory factor (Ser/Thr protein kinase)
MTRGLFDELGRGDEPHMPGRRVADEPPTPAAFLTLNMARCPRAPRVVRQTVAGWLDGLGVPPTFIEEVRLVVSELVTNAVTHANSAVRVRADVDDGRLRLEVHDESSQPPALIDTPTPAGGYGLHFVAQLTDDWGGSTTPTGKRVWIERRFADPIPNNDANAS